MSLNLNPAYVGSHWEAVEEGAARAGRTALPRRLAPRAGESSSAETDEEAMRFSAGDMMGRMMGEYFLPLLANFGFTDFLKHDPDVPDSEVTPRILRAAQLGDRLTGHRRREARAGLRGGSAASAPCSYSASTTPTRRRSGGTPSGC